MSVRILHGDCRDVLKTLPDASVHCCVTSPPYFGLRDYGMAEQIGLEQTPDAFVAELVAVFREVRRVLRDDGTLFLNLGDSYFGSSQTGGTKGKEGSAKRSGRMFSKAAGAQRAIPYGTSGTEPAGSQASDCLCGSLCDACRKAYRIGKSHSDAPPAPMLGASIPASTLGHTESLPDHLPTSGLPGQADHSAVANPDLGQTAGRAAAPLPGVPASMQRESSRQHPEGSHLSGQPSECLLCGCSLQGSAPASVRMAECNCDTAQSGSVSDNSGRGAVSSAYPHLTTESLKPKDLIGIPWRVAFALQADGWYLRQDIIWHKPNPMPESVTDRCTKAHEYVFLMSRSARYFCDMDAIAEPFAHPEMQQEAKNRKASGALKTGAYMEGSGRNDGASYTGGVGFASCSDTRNKRSVWTIATKPYSEAHFATMTPELAETCIKAGCPVGGVVLDPFGGAGTTGLVADRLQRDALLIELNPDYAQIAEKRIKGDAPLFSEVSA